MHTTTCWYKWRLVESWGCQKQWWHITFSYAKARHKMNLMCCWIPGGAQLKKLRYQIPSGGGECYSQGPRSNLGILSHGHRYVINQTHHSMCSGYCLTSKLYYNILTTFIYYLCSDKFHLRLCTYSRLWSISFLQFFNAICSRNDIQIPVLCCYLLTYAHVILFLWCYESFNNERRWNVRHFFTSQWYMLFFKVGKGIVFPICPWLAWEPFRADRTVIWNIGARRALRLSEHR